MARYAMIMAGGAGTRLWPVSRKHLPKQLVRFIPGQDGEAVSLLRIAAERIGDLVSGDHRLICTNEAYRAEIRATIPGFDDEQILGEPVGRDTVNAVGLTAAVLHRRDPDAVFAVLTADHLITPEPAFRERLGVGFDLVDRDPRSLVTFSIKPTYAATGFGYVEHGVAIPGVPGAARVERFVEKPSAERAQAYLDSGVFGWNAGMFVWKAATLLDCLHRYKPESYAGLAEIAAAWDTPDRQTVLDRIYPELPKISVDYAIMEPASREQQRANEDSVSVATVTLDIDWLDVGSWPSFCETLEPDAAGNRVSAIGGEAHLVGCERVSVIAHGTGHRVAVLGASDLIVVHTPDATLIMPPDKAQELKSLHGELPDMLK
ncbi:MAG: mannose-1-phosphate guanylyltransferase [Planctomycetota bacterium]